MHIVWDDSRNPLDIVSLAEAKAHLRVDHSGDDASITALIGAAVKVVETEANVKIFTHYGVLYLNDWPRATRNNPRASIVIPAMPLMDVSQVATLNDPVAGTYGLVDGTDWGYDEMAMPGYVYLRNGQSWPALPTPSEEPNRVKVTFTAGPVTAPDDAKHAVKWLVAHWYENREAVVVGTIATNLPLGFDRLVATFAYPLACPAECLPVGGGGA